MRIRFFILLFLSLNVFAQDIPEKPNPPRLVNDYVGGLLSDAQINALENKLVAYHDSTSTQIAVVIVNSTQPYEIADYALQLGRKWGVGQEGKNNGIVLLWAAGDRKVTIQTGYGMEGALPDIYAKRIITHIITPNFQAAQYYQGLDEATTAIIKYAQGEYKAEPKEEGLPAGLILLLILAVIIFVIMATKGGGGNRGGGRSILNDSPWPYTTYTGWGRQSGQWGGGSFGGGRGGGFGGFGGGSFGGGGASGSY